MAFTTVLWMRSLLGVATDALRFEAHFVVTGLSSSLRGRSLPLLLLAVTLESRSTSTVRLAPPLSLPGP